MAAVNFYRFAAAMMEMLEPEKYNFTRKTSPETSGPDSASPPTTTNLPNIASREINSLVPTIASSDLDTLASKETESKTVSMVAKHLTDLITNASEDKLIKVASVIKEVTDAIPIPAALLRTTEITGEATKANVNVHEATAAIDLVQATVQTFALQATSELKAENTEPLPLTTSDELEVAPKSFKTKATEIVTDAIIDKINETVELTGNSASLIPESNHSKKQITYLLTNNVETNCKNEKTQEIEQKDFWAQFPELDPSQIKYFEQLTYFYDFMKESDVLDLFDPAIDLNQKYKGVTGAMVLANSKFYEESQVDMAQERSQIERKDQAREVAPELREANSQRREEQNFQLLSEQKKLAERIAIERLREAL